MITGVLRLLCVCLCLPMCIYPLVREPDRPGVIRQGRVDTPSSQFQFMGPPAPNSERDEMWLWRDLFPTPLRARIMHIGIDRRRLSAVVELHNVTRSPVKVDVWGIRRTLAEHLEFWNCETGQCVVVYDQNMGCASTINPKRKAFAFEYLEIGPLSSAEIGDEVPLGDVECYGFMAAIARGSAEERLSRLTGMPAGIYMANMQLPVLYRAEELSSRLGDELIPSMNLYKITIGDDGCSK